MALLYRETEIDGYSVVLAISKLLLKYGISWDTGSRPTGHYGTRDTGTVEDTNFEAVRIPTAPGLRYELVDLLC